MTFSASKSRVNRAFTTILSDNLSTITGGCVTLYPVSDPDGGWNTFFQENGVSIRTTSTWAPNTVMTARRVLTITTSGTYRIKTAMDDVMTLRVGSYTFSGLSYYNYGCSYCSPYETNVYLEAGMHLIEASVDNSGGGDQGFALSITELSTSLEVFNFRNRLSCFDAGYILLSYDWGTADGQDLDTSTFFTNTDPSLDTIPVNVDIDLWTEADRVNTAVGWSHNETSTGFNGYLIWAGDNTASDGEEQVLVNFDKVIQDYPNLTNLTISVGGRWYNVRNSGNVLITARLYDKFTTFSDVGTTFNPSKSAMGTISTTKNVVAPGAPPNGGTGPFPFGETVLLIDVNLISRTISFRNP